METFGQTPLSPLEASRLNPLRLAYMGDTVWELLVRQRQMAGCGKVRNMHRETVGAVNAGAQSLALQRLVSSLTEEEMDVVRRGRNATPRHHTPKGQQPGDYHAATGLEALFGFLYLSGQHERLTHLFEIARQEAAACPPAT